jgi:hypothetical protein
MNIRGLANRLTVQVNPNLPAQVQASLGYMTGDTGKRVPVYADPITLSVQMQALSKKEIEHLDALNLSNSTAAVYANRQLTGIDRTTGSGGDLITFGSVTTLPAELRGSAWLVTTVLEGWVTSGWCKVAVTRQMP